MRPFRLYLALAATIVIGIGAVYLASTSMGRRERPQASSNPSAPGNTQVLPHDKPDHVYQVVVTRPSPTDMLDSREETVEQGQVVAVVVTSPFAGTLIVHGLTDPQHIGKNGHVTLRFRAIYSGRFDLHFHGSDGSHIPLMAFDVLPGGAEH